MQADADRHRQRRRLLIAALVVVLLILLAGVAGEAMLAQRGTHPFALTAGGAGQEPAPSSAVPLAVTTLKLDPTPAPPGARVLVTVEAMGAEAVELRPSWSDSPIRAESAGDGRTWTALLGAPTTAGKHPILVTARAGQQTATLGGILAVEGPPPVPADPGGAASEPGSGARPIPAPAPMPAPQPSPVPTPLPEPRPKPPADTGAQPERPKRPPSLAVIEWGAVRKIVEWQIGEAVPTADFGGGWERWQPVSACGYQLARPKPQAAHGPVASADRSVPIYALRVEWWIPCKEAAPATLVLSAAKSPGGPWYRVTAAPSGPDRTAEALLPDDLLGATELWVRTDGEGGPSEWGLWGWYVTPGTWRQGGSA